MLDEALAPRAMVGVTRGLIRHRDKAHVGSIWLHRDTDEREDVVWVVIRARGEEVCRLRIPTAELMGDRPYAPPVKPKAGEGTARQPPLLP